MATWVYMLEFWIQRSDVKIAVLSEILVCYRFFLDRNG